MRNLVGVAVFDKLGRMPDEPQDSDAELMLRVQRGDRQAFETLVDKYKQPVMNLVFRMLRDATEAEDLAQNVFVQVFRSADRYRVTAKFSTWLFTIARNLSLNEIRRRSRHPAHSLDQLQEAGKGEGPGIQITDRAQVAPNDMALRTELARCVRAALDDLAENQRTAIALFQEQQMPYEEIGRILGCSLSATKSLIHRGRETLKLRLQPYLKSGSWK